MHIEYSESNDSPARGTVIFCLIPVSVRTVRTHSPAGSMLYTIMAISCFVGGRGAGKFANNIKT